MTDVKWVLFKNKFSWIILQNFSTKSWCIILSTFQFTSWRSYTSQVENYIKNGKRATSSAHTANRQIIGNFSMPWNILFRHSMITCSVFTAAKNQGIDDQSSNQYTDFLRCLSNWVMSYSSIGCTISLFISHVL